MAFQLLEPDVALTDYGLTLLSLVLAWLIYRTKNTDNRLKIMVTFFYLSLALGSAIGGTVHGFFPLKMSLGHAILWQSTLIVIGITALLLWLIVGELLFPKYRVFITYVVSAEFALYAMYILFLNQEFRIALYNYIPPTILLLVSFIYCQIKSGKKFFLLGISGILLTFIAAFIQQSKIASHPIYFNHNALYHSIQIVALILIFANFKLLLKKRRLLRKYVAS